MASVLISLSTPVEKLTDRELMQAYIHANEMHDHLAGPDAPLPDCVTVMWDELLARGYQWPTLANIKERLA